MKLYYYRDKRGNFGDDLNAWLWPRLIPNFFDDNDREILVGIGTILNNHIPRSPLKCVFSTGYGYAGPPPVLDESWRVYCVRGPMTAKSLGVDPKLAITDGAAMLRLLKFEGPTTRKGTAFIPHHKSAREANWKTLCEDEGMTYIDPTGNVEDVLRSIRSSEMIITEAMHGAIVADAFRVPWIPVVVYREHVLDFKWLDWCASLGLKYQPHKLPHIYQWQGGLPGRAKAWLKWRQARSHLRRLSRSVRPSLSCDEAIESATARLEETLSKFRDEHRVGSGTSYE